MAHWPVWTVAALAGMWGVAVSGGEAQTPQLTPGQAQTAARSELLARLPILPPAYGRAFRGALAGDPLHVDRLDASERSYYVVPFCHGPLTSLLVVIDASTGRFLEASYLQTPAAYPHVSEDKARRLVLASVSEPRDKNVAGRAAALLVWRPCEQSQSAFEPFWRFALPSGDRYVDQTGGVHRALTEPRLKGGGPPGA